jgi:hypothetical protein
VKIELGSDPLEWHRIDCPYCGESYDTAIDTSAGASSYVEDCAVCCQPIVVTIDIDPADYEVRIRVRRELD